MRRKRNGLGAQADAFPRRQGNDGIAPRFDARERRSCREHPRDEQHEKTAPTMARVVPDDGRRDRHQERQDEDRLDDQRHDDRARKSRSDSSGCQYLTYCTASDTTSTAKLPTV